MKSVTVLMISTFIFSCSGSNSNEVLIGEAGIYYPREKNEEGAFSHKMSSHIYNLSDSLINTHKRTLVRH